MKFLLAAINAKYIHSNPGVYSLRAFARTKIPGADIEIGEYTINHQMDLILQDIYRRKPDFIGFSCYIWNISQVYELVRDLKQVLPETEIWLGGPEVSYDSGRILSQEPEIRGIMRGEGELTFSQVAEAYLKYLYSPEGQEIAAKNFYRPRDPNVAKKYANEFPKLKLFTIDQEFGGWTKAQKEHFSNGGTFDQISQR